MKKLKNIISVILTAVLITGSLSAFSFDSSVVRYDLTQVSAKGENASISVEEDAGKERFVYIRPTGQETTAFVEFTLKDMPAGLYNVSLSVKGGPGKGIYALSIDDTAVGKAFNLYSENAYIYEISLGNVEIAGGETKVKLTCEGRAQNSIAAAAAVRNIAFTRVTEQENINYDAVDRKVLPQTYTHPVKDRAFDNIMKQFYVDPASGSDTNDGSEEYPFKSIAAAKNAVRLINKNMTGDIVVNLRGGIYYPEISVYPEELCDPGEGNTAVVRETRNVTKSDLDFNEADSGCNGFYVVYRAYEGETPVISGEKIITGWELYDAEKNIYSAPSGGIETRQVFIDGQRAVRSTSGFTADNFNNAFKNCTVTEEGLITSDDYFLDWNNIDDVECVFTNKEYWSPRIGIKGAVRGDDGMVHITMKEPAWGNVLLSRKTKGIAGGPATIENAYELIDEDNEWYLDTHAKRFFYKLPKDKNIDEVTVTAGVIEELLNVRGTSNKSKVQNIVFDSITFRGTTWMRPSSDNGFPDCQAGLIRETVEYANQEGKMPIAGLTVKYADKIGIKDCRITGMGGNGIVFSDGCRDCIVYGNVVSDISGTGIAVGEVQKHQRTAYGEERVINCDVMYNIVKDCAKEYHAAVGISAGLPVDTDISFNEISQCLYTGIHVGWGFYGDEEIEAMSQLMMNMRIQNNLIYDTTLLLTDGAAIYTRGHMAAGDNPNIISGNYFLRGNGKVSNGIYYDCDTTNWYSVDNVVEDMVSAYFSHVWNTTNTFKNIYADINSKRAAVFNAEDAKNQYPSLQRNIVVDDFHNLPQAAKDIVKNAGLPDEYKHLRTEKQGEMFRLVPKNRIIELDTGDSEKMEFEAYDIYNNKLDTTNLKLRYNTSSIIGHFSQYKAQNNQMDFYSSDADENYHIKVDSDGLVTALGIPTGSIFVEGELNGIKRYTCVSVTDKTSRNVQTDLKYTQTGVGVTNFYSNVEKEYSHILDMHEGSKIEYTVPAPKANGTYNVAVWSYRGPTRGKFRIYIDGKDTGNIIDFYNPTNGSGSDYVKYNILSSVELYGQDTIKVMFECAGKNEKSSGTRLPLFNFYFAPYVDLNNTAALEPGNSYAHINGFNVLIDKENDKLAPYIKNGRTMVPIRFISEISGADVKWNDSLKQASITLNGNNVVITQNSCKIAVNGEEKTIDCAAENSENRLFIPLRAVTEGLGLKVKWYEQGLILVGNEADKFEKADEVYGCLAALHVR